MKTHAIYESDSSIDDRHIKCACGESRCRIGLRFDCEPVIMFLTDKYGNNHAMYLKKSTIKDLIKQLKKL